MEEDKENSEKAHWLTNDPVQLFEDWEAKYTLLLLFILLLIVDTRFICKLSAFTGIFNLTSKIR